MQIRLKLPEKYHLADSADRPPRGRRDYWCASCARGSASNQLASTRRMHAAGAWATVDGDDDYFSTCLRSFPRIDTEIIRGADEGRLIVHDINHHSCVISIDYFSIRVFFRFVINDSIMRFTEMSYKSDYIKLVKSKYIVRSNIFGLKLS